MLLTMRRRNTTPGLFYGSRKAQLWNPPEGVEGKSRGEIPGKIPPHTQQQLNTAPCSALEQIILLAHPGPAALISYAEKEREETRTS